MAEPETKVQNGDGAPPELHVPHVNGETTPATTAAKINFSLRYWKDLVDYARLAQEEPPIGQFKKLHTINITHLLSQLASIKASIEHDKTSSVEQMDLLQLKLHRYTNAVRDYQYILSLLEHYAFAAREVRMDLEGAFPDFKATYPEEEGNLPYDTVYHTTKPRKAQLRDPIREFLRTHLPRRFSWSLYEQQQDPLVFRDGEVPELYSPLVNGLASFVVGLVGGAALIVPMVIMALDPMLWKSLVVVSVFVVAFALVLAMGLKLGNQETIVATATYAAVLVVFVGNGVAGG